MNEISENILNIREQIARVAKRAGRKPTEIKIMAVSKSVSYERITKAIAAGVDIVGENYIQEAQSKEATLESAPALHFIGHLQTNKAKYAVRLFDMIHSVDRFELAREIDKRARALNKTQDVLLEINLGGEETKSGVAPTAAVSLLEQMAQMENLCVRGLMTMPPPEADIEKTRHHFVTLRKMRDELRLLKIANAPLEELSMGMSDDYEVAIEEGATIIRIGRGIFGERQPKSIAE